MATSVQDIVTEQRLLVRDTVTAKYLWSDAEMVYALNETMRQIGLRNPVHDTCGQFNLTMVAGEPVYYYDSCILFLETVTRASDETALTKVTYKRKDYVEAGNPWRDDNEGYPSEYIENINDRSLRVYPTPSTDYLDTLYLTAYRTYKNNYTSTDLDDQYITDMDVDHYRFAILMGMQSYLYRKADSNTYREELAQYAEYKFNELVGRPLSMREIEARRENAHRKSHFIVHPYSPKTRHIRSYRSGVEDW